MDIDVAVDGPMTVDDTTGLPSKARKPAARVTVKSGGVNEDRFASPTHVALAAPRDGPGAYSICLDNSGSRYTEKVVSLAVRTSEDKGNAAVKHKKDKKKGGRNAENVEKVEGASSRAGSYYAGGQAGSGAAASRSTGPYTTRATTAWSRRRSWRRASTSCVASSSSSSCGAGSRGREGCCPCTRGIWTKWLVVISR